MSEELYEDAIVALARAAHGAGKPAGEGNSATIDNPLCGDRVTVEVTLADGRIKALSHNVKGCLLCKASASMLGLHAPGASRDAIAANAAALDAMLKTGDAPAYGSWPELALFLPVSRHKSRFDCVRLPLQAAAKALGETP
ncbi:MAG: iron-sulfur cluster assembly scaffold protein [Alphaproteobacteria bacterium]|nr:iron-sulfur cluster assembly scaffold protein [Alphaproteobacteria bacterium]